MLKLVTFKYIIYVSLEVDNKESTSCVRLHSISTICSCSSSSVCLAFVTCSVCECRYCEGAMLVMGAIYNYTYIYIYRYVYTNHFVLLVHMHCNVNATHTRCDCVLILGGNNQLRVLGQLGFQLYLVSELVWTMYQFKTCVSACVWTFHDKM